MEETIDQRIETVLDKIRPFLAREGGDVRLARFDADTGICYVDMVGACSGCTLAASDVSDSIEVMLMDEIPEITRVELVQPDFSDEYSQLIKKLQEAQQKEIEEEEKAYKEAALKAKEEKKTESEVK